MELSIVIPTRNRREILKKCLERLFAQTYPADKFEIVIVDDGSRDQTDEMVKSLNPPCKIKYLKQDPGKSGPAAANNLGIKESSGEYILFMNSDLLAKKNMLEEHLKLHHQFPNLIVQGRAVNTISLEDPTQKPSGYTGYTEINFGYFITWNASIRKDTLLKAGLFDEDFKNMSWEDVELGYRLRKLGIKQKFNQNAIGYHYTPPFKLTEKEINWTKAKSIGMGQNAVLYYLKHPCLETKIASQLVWYSRCIFGVLSLLVKISGKKKILNYLQKLETSGRHKTLAFWFGLAGWYWYMKGVNEAWKNSSAKPTLP